MPLLISGTVMNVLLSHLVASAANVPACENRTVSAPSKTAEGMGLIFIVGKQ